MDRRIRGGVRIVVSALLVAAAGLTWPYPTRRGQLRLASLPFLRRVMFIIAGLVMVIAVQAHATIMPGDQFIIDFSETSPSNIPDIATATVTIDGPSASPGFDKVSNLSVIGQGGNCLTCGLISQDLSFLLFDTTSLDLSGTVTGSFLGSGGNLHTFTLALTDAPNPTWTFTNVRVFDQRTDISSGPYTTQIAPVPEPASILLVSTSLAALAGTAAWRKLRRRPI